MKKRIEAATKHKEMRAEVTNGKKFVDVLLGVDKQPTPIKQGATGTLIIMQLLLLFKWDRQSDENLLTVTSQEEA